MAAVGSIGPLFRFTEARGSISNVTEKSSLNLVYILTPRLLDFSVTLEMEPREKF